MASYRMRELHDQLNTKALAAQEEWPYMPHLTIVKMSANPRRSRLIELLVSAGAHFEGSRDIQVSELTFVREDEQNCWVDLGGVPLGRQLVVASFDSARTPLDIHASISADSFRCLEVHSPLTSRAEVRRPAPAFHL